MNTSRQCQQTTYFQHSRQLHRNVNAVHSTAAQACLRHPSNFSFAWRPKELTGDEQHPAKIKITAWHQQSGHAHAITRSRNWLDCCKYTQSRRIIRIGDDQCPAHVRTTAWHQNQIMTCAHHHPIWKLVWALRNIHCLAINCATVIFTLLVDVSAGNKDKVRMHIVWYLSCPAFSWWNEKALKSVAVSLCSVTGLSFNS